MVQVNVLDELSLCSYLYVASIQSRSMFQGVVVVGKENRLGLPSIRLTMLLLLLLKPNYEKEVAFFFSLVFE